MRPRPGSLEELGVGEPDTLTYDYPEHSADHTPRRRRRAVTPDELDRARADVERAARQSTTRGQR